MTTARNRHTHMLCLAFHITSYLQALSLAYEGLLDEIFPNGSNTGQVTDDRVRSPRPVGCASAVTCHNNVQCMG